MWTSERVCVCVCVCAYAHAHVHTMLACGRVGMWRWCPIFWCRTKIERCWDIHDFFNEFVKNWTFWIMSSLVINHGYSSTALKLKVKTPSVTVSSSRKPDKLRMLCSRLKRMMLLDTKFVMHHEYLPVGLTVNQYFCKDVLEHLREKWLEFWPPMTWYDSLSLIFIKKQFLPQNKIALVQSAACLPGLTCCELSVFKTKKFHAGNHLTIWNP